MKLTNAVRKSQSGFSLIELMVVVAIIGILAAIGIPQYSKFQARARQSEAKSSLSALYLAEQSFFGEWNAYSTDLNNIGFGVQGTNLRYTAGFTQTTCGTMPAGAPAEAGRNQVHIIAPSAVTWRTPGITAAAGALATGFPTTSCSDTAFIGGATGDPKNTPAALSGTNPWDTWTINQNKAFSNVTVGL